MANPSLTRSQMQEAVDTRDKLGSIKGAAERLGLPYRTMQQRLRRAREEDITPTGMEIEPLPAEDAPLHQIIERRRAEYDRRRANRLASKLQRVKVKTRGPIAVCHLGDPHLDDPGCDIADVERHIEVINRTEGMFGASIGDYQNNWVGRLAHLYGAQETSRKQAWKLVEWFVGSVPWLYLIGGNHDYWAGDGDPIIWMQKQSQCNEYRAHGARLALDLPGGREVRINARHDFRGHSQWNKAHGPSKAVQMGMRDHIAIAGHLHISAYQPVKCPMSGLISHCIRVASFKRYDSFGEQIGAVDHHFSPSVTTVIQPARTDDDPDMIHVFYDVAEAAKYLAWLRSKDN